MPNKEHLVAQELAASAELARARGNIENARSLYAQAADLELAGLNLLLPDKPRSRGILAVSYASLLFKAELYDRAESALCRSLADEEIPTPFKDQLRELLQITWEERLLQSERLRYSGAEIMIALRGGKIGAGTAPADIAVRYLNGFNLLSYRAAECDAGFPLRRKGLPPVDIQEFFQARATQPAQGSYRFSLKLLEPAQQELFGDITERRQPDAHRVSNIVMEVLRAVAKNDPDALAGAIPNLEYRLALARLARNIIPMGEALDEVEVRTEKDRPMEAIRLVPGVRKNVNEAIRELAQPDDQEGSHEETVIGILRAVHLDRHWIRIVPDEGQPIQVATSSEDLDDVIGPMMNRKVVARISRRGRFERSRPKLLDLELQED